MKRIRILIIVLILFLITGCSGTYNINIGKDLKVKEELNIVLEDEAKNRDKFNTLLENNVDKEDYTLVEEGNNLKLAYIHEYIGLEDYLLNSKVYKQLFDKVNYNTDGREVSFDASNIFNLKNSSLNGSNKVNLIQINVTTPLEVIDDNSDLSTENTYSWTIDSDTQEKDIHITFNLDEGKLNAGTIMVLATVLISAVVIVIMVVRRLLESRKI